MGARARPSSRAIPRTGCILRKREDGAAERSRRRYQADARHAREGAAEGPGLAVRGQVGRLPRDRLCPGRRGPARQPQRQGSDRALSDRRARARARRQDPRLRAGRRGLRARRGRTGHVLGHAAGPARHQVHLRRLRPARGRGRATGGPAAHRTARPAREAHRSQELRRAGLRGVRGWRRALARPRSSRGTRAWSPSGRTRATSRVGARASGSSSRRTTRRSS